MKQKTAAVLFLSAVLSAAAACTAFAGEWIHNDADNTWSYLKDDGLFASGDEWVWINGFCYCFDASGVMYSGTVTPDGYTVGQDGAWTVDGVVQQQNAPSVSRVATPFFTFEVPAAWEGKFTWRTFEDRTVVFYSRANLAFGGHLFSIISRPDFVTEDQFPDFGEILYIGALQDAYTGEYSYLYSAGPSDVPYDYNDPALSAEYLSMADAETDVIHSIEGIHGERLIYQGKAID